MRHFGLSSPRLTKHFTGKGILPEPALQFCITWGWLYGLLMSAIPSRYSRWRQILFWSHIMFHSNLPSLRLLQKGIRCDGTEQLSVCLSACLSVCGSRSGPLWIARLQSGLTWPNFGENLYCYVAMCHFTCIRSLPRVMAQPVQLATKTQLNRKWPNRSKNNTSAQFHSELSQVETLKRAANHATFGKYSVTPRIMVQIASNLDHRGALNVSYFDLGMTLHDLSVTLAVLA